MQGWWIFWAVSSDLGWSRTARGDFELWAVERKLAFAIHAHWWVLSKYLLYQFDATNIKSNQNPVSSSSLSSASPSSAPGC